jgi:hypothetical protein
MPASRPNAHCSSVMVFASGPSGMAVSFETRVAVMKTHYPTQPRHPAGIEVEASAADAQIDRCRVEKHVEMQRRDDDTAWPHDQVVQTDVRVDAAITAQ